MSELYSRRMVVIVIIMMQASMSLAVPCSNSIRWSFVIIIGFSHKHLFAST